jgi:hypothetical protein
MVALAVKAVVAGEVPPGCHHAADVLDPALADHFRPVELAEAVEGAL